MQEWGHSLIFPFVLLWDMKTLTMNYEASLLQIWRVKPPELFPRNGHIFIVFWVVVIDKGEEMAQ